MYVSSVFFLPYTLKTLVNKLFHHDCGSVKLSITLNFALNVSLLYI